MIFETLEVDNIKSTIKRASRWRHNSYDWVEEWDWIDSHLIIADKKIKEQQEEIDRLTIAYKNASDQRQHYVDKCLMLSEVVLELAHACSAAVHWCVCECDLSVGYICIGCNIDKDLTKYKDLIESINTTKDER